MLESPNTSAIEEESVTIILNDLSELLFPSDTLAVKVYVVSPVTGPAVPLTTPVDEFNVSPVGKEPDNIEYVKDWFSSSVAEIVNDAEFDSITEPIFPEEVAQTGESLTVNTS